MRRVEAGEVITITVSGRIAARLVGAESRAWRRFDDVRDLFSGPADPDRDEDRGLLDQAPSNPWDAG